MDWLERLNRATGRVPLTTGDGVGIAEVLHWAYSPHLPDNVPHRHAYFEVCLVGAQGRGVFHAGGTEHPLNPGTLFIARPGVVHQIVNTATPDMELFWVSFAWATTPTPCPLLSAFADADTVLAVPDTGGRIGAIWAALRSAAGASPSPADDPALTALMGALLLAVAQTGAGAATCTETAAPGTGLERRAVRFIHDNLGRRTLTVAEVADAVHLSPRHLTRLFVGFAGTAPAAYIAQARLDRARTLLLRTDDPLKQIATLVGYADVQHFTRAFARRFGCPPGRYRATHGRADQTEREGHRLTPGTLL